MTGRLRTLVTAVALLAAAVGLLMAGTGGKPSGAADRAAALSEQLRCPTCTAESIADSQAPMAAAMRETVREQVAMGRRDEQIRDWFVARYGTRVLLAPPVRGVSAAVWALPVVALVVGLGGWYGIRRRRTPEGASPSAATCEPPPAADTRMPERLRPGPGGSGPRTLLLSAAGASAVAVVLVWLGALGEQDAGAPGAVAAVSTEQEVEGDRPSTDPVLAALREAVREEPDRLEAWLALGRALEQRDRLAEARHAYARVLEEEPGHLTAQFLQAFVLVRMERPAPALRHLEAVLDREPRHAEALLLLGTVQSKQGDPAAEATLSRFLRVAPDHPASDHVRGLLAKEEEKGRW